VLATVISFAVSKLCGQQAAAPHLLGVVPGGGHQQKRRVSCECAKRACDDLRALLAPAHVDDADAPVPRRISERGGGGIDDVPARRSDAEREDSCVRRDPVDAVAVLRRAGDDRRDVRPMAQWVALERPPGDEVAAGEQSTGEGGRAEVEAAVDHGDDDALAARVGQAPTASTPSLER
jgi:hypothetical protein